MRLSRFLDDLKLKYLRVHILCIKHFKNGKWQLAKEAGLPIGWSDPRLWERDYKRFRPYWPYHRLENYNSPEIIKTIKDALFIATGPVNRLYCIDVDSDTFVDHLKKNNFDICKKAQTRSCSKRLPHLYVQSDEETASNKFWIGKEEIGDFKCQRVGGQVDGMFERDVELESFKLAKISEPEYELIFSLLRDSKTIKTADRMIRTFNHPRKLTKEQEEILYEIIEYLPGDEIYTYDDWVAWGEMFFVVFGDQGFDMWCKYSCKVTTKYDYDSQEKTWVTLTDHQRTGIGKLFACLYRHAPVRKFFSLVKRYYYSQVRDQLIPKYLFEYYNQIYNEKYFMDIPEIKERCIVLDGAMGLGKTSCIKRYLQTQNKRFICITARVSLANSLSQAFEADNYQDLHFNYINHTDRLCIQLESLTKLYVPDKEYCMILDEFTSILHQLNSQDTMDNDKRVKTYKLFKRLIDGSSKIIVSEAFMHRGANDILRLLIDPEDIYHVKNTYKYKQRERVVTMYNSELSNYMGNKMCINTAGTKLLALLQTQKLYIFASTKKWVKQLHKFFQSNGIKGKAYHSKMDDSQRLDFNDVNTAWNQVGYTLTTTSCMVGLSYDLWEDFDAVVFIGSAFGSSVRDSIQSLHRVRYPKTSDIHFFVSKGCDYRAFKTKQDILEDYEYIAKELGLEDNTEPWIRENVINSRLERAVSSSLYHQMLDSYLEWIGAKECRYEVIDEIINIQPVEEVEIGDLTDRDLIRMYNNIKNNRATEEEKEMYDRYLLKHFFVDGYPHIKKLKSADIKKLRLIRALRFGIEPNKYSTYLTDDLTVKYELYKLLFDELNIDIHRVDDFGESAISPGSIDSLDRDLLESLLGKRIKSNLNGLRSVLGYIKLGLQEKRTMKNRVRRIDSYKVVDREEVWAWLDT